MAKMQTTCFFRGSDTRGTVPSRYLSSIIACDDKECVHRTIGSLRIPAKGVRGVLKKLLSRAMPAVKRIEINVFGESASAVEDIDVICSMKGYELGILFWSPVVRCDAEPSLFQNINRLDPVWGSIVSFNFNNHHCTGDVILYLQHALMSMKVVRKVEICLDSVPHVSEFVKTIEYVLLRGTLRNLVLSMPMPGIEMTRLITAADYGGCDEVEFRVDRILGTFNQARRLSSVKKLCVMDRSDGFIFPSFVKYMYESCMLSTSLTTLKLSTFSLGCNYVRALALAISTSVNLKDIVFRMIYHPTGWAQIVSGLSDSHSLRRAHLDILVPDRRGSSHIPDGILYLMLRTRSISELYFDLYPRADLDDAQALVNTAASNPVMRSVELISSGISFQYTDDRERNRNFSVAQDQQPLPFDADVRAISIDGASMPPGRIESILSRTPSAPGATNIKISQARFREISEFNRVMECVSSYTHLQSFSILGCDTSSD